MKTKRAIIYTRVSSDEQAEKGYSLQYQEEQLRKYCGIREITIVAHYQEDYSAKTFDRPEFNKLMAFCAKSVGDVDYLLFTNWSRFGRNAGDSYAVIKRLGQLDIEPQAIEQPLDLKVPENKMMLAFYLASPEVENDRRSLNVRAGVYRAKKEGRWTTLAPIGYKNKRTEDGRAVIVPDPQYADLVKESFEQFATGSYSIEELRKKMVDKGLHCIRARFPLLLRNKAYIAKIAVPAYKDEPAYDTDAIHEPLISQDIFYQVQDILEGRAPKRPTKNTRKEQFPLRGFMECRKCGKNISGSASRGAGGDRYHYYHCTCGCDERFKASVANDSFRQFLDTYKPNPAVLDLNYQILLDYFQSQKNSDQAELKKVDDDLNKSKTRLQNVQHLMLDGDIDAKEYKEIKAKLEIRNDELLRKRASLCSAQEDFVGYLKKGAAVLRSLDVLYDNASVSDKQLIISSVFPEKLIFEEGQFRTKRVNEAVRLMCLNPSDLDQKKSGVSKKFSLTSTQVGVTGFEPATSSSRTRRATGLRYTPKICLIIFKLFNQICANDRHAGASSDTRHRAPEYDTNQN